VADVCICGGAESKTNPMALMRQILGKRLSTNNDQPEQACRPFGATRDGTVVSEGGGLVILEDLEHARARGARIYAELIGFGASNDAYDAAQPSKPHPEGRGLVLAARKAWKDANIGADTIDLVSAFACGLPERDALEAKALNAILGQRVGEVPTLAIKGGLGNNGAGSGAIDLIATVLAVYHATIPPMVNGDAPDPDFGLKLITKDPVDANLNVAMCNAYALGGGQNASLIIQRYRE